MRDTEDRPERPETDFVLLAQAGNGYWLLQGEDHLGAILAGEPGYPTPVRAVAFNTIQDLEAFLNTQGVSLNSLWNVHPAVVARLRDDNELVMLTPPGSPQAPV